MDFLSPGNLNYLVREVKRRFAPEVPVKVIVPKLRTIMNDWYQFQLDKFGKSVFELNDKFISDMILDGQLFAPAEYLGCDRNCPCGGRSSQFNISICSGLAGPTGSYTGENCPTVFGDCPKAGGTTPDLDAYYMKLMSNPSQMVINSVLHRNKMTKCSRSYANAMPANKVVEEEYCDNKVSGHRRHRCGRCNDNSPQCNIPYGVYETECPSNAEPYVRDGTV